MIAKAEDSPGTEMGEEDEQCDLFVAGALVADNVMGTEFPSEGPVRSSNWCCENDISLSEGIC